LDLKFENFGLGIAFYIYFISRSAQLKLTGKGYHLSCVRVTSKGNLWLELHFATVD